MALAATDSSSVIVDWNTVDSGLFLLEGLTPVPLALALATSAILRHDVLSDSSVHLSKFHIP